MSGESLAPTWLPWLGGWAVKSLLLFILAGVVLLALRRASASARHLVCLLTLAALLALPVLSLTLPGWRLTVPFVTTPASPAPMPSSLPMAAVPAPTGPGATAQVIPFAPPSAKLAPFLVLPPSAAAPAAPHPFPWAFSLITLWLCGALLAGLRPLLGLWGIRQLSSVSQSITGPGMLALTAECASALGLAQTPGSRQADAPIPMTWGWRRPVVLLPADAQNWPPDRLRAVLLHEMAHIRRRDWLSHRFADVVCAFYWFHPLVWLTARRLRLESEIACDDLVLTSGVAASDYARHLLDIARALCPAPAAVPQAAIAMARTARIEGRLTMILDTTRPRLALTRRALLIVFGLSAAALVPLAVLRPGARAQAAAPAGASQRHQYKDTVYYFPPGISLQGGAGGVPVQLAYVTQLAPATRDSGALHGPRQRRVGFTFRIPSTAQDVTVKYDLTGCLFSSSAGTWQSKMQSTSHQTEAQLNPQTNGSRIVTATFPASVSKTNVRVGIASGPWKVIGTARRDGSGQIDGLGLQQGHTGYIFSPLAETKVGTMLTISVNAATGPSPEDLRIVAVDRQGRQLLPTDIGDRSIGALDQITARFALPSAQIRELRLESRPFRYVEFKNVALRPFK